MKEKLSKSSLEDLFIAIIRLKTERGIPTNLQPADVLQPWILENEPHFEILLKPGITV